ncbi:MAG: hypothetical protein EBQ99_07740 [Planctomycetes bacterium]|nr:hypothetical protein [Planctomycetota bacterium]
MTDSPATPSRLALFARSPLSGAWWDELEARGLFDDQRPAISALDQQLLDDGVRHERVLLNQLEREGYSVARLPGKQSADDHAATLAEARRVERAAGLRADETA